MAQIAEVSMPDRFSEEPPSLREWKRQFFAEPKCECRFTGDIADASDCPLHNEPCKFCGLLGGTPFLMMEDGLRCSRCFEDFTPLQFHQWLHEFPQRAEVWNEEGERAEIVAEAQRFQRLFSPSPAKRNPASCVQGPKSKQEAA